MPRIIILLSICLLPNIAFAYIDPGTGTYFVQALLALVGAVVFYFTHPAHLIKWIVGKWRAFLQLLRVGKS